MSLKKISRRAFVRAGGGLAVAATLAACGDTTSTSVPVASTSAASTGAATTTSAAASTSAAATTSAAASASTTAVTSAAASTSAAATTSVGAVSGPLKQIKYALPTVPILSYSEAYVAKEGGFWAKEGLDVTLVSGSGTASSLQQVATKTAFAARGGAITSIITRDTQAVPIRSIYAIYRGVQFVIITNDAKGIKTPADMKGRNIGVVSRNGSTEQLLDLVLAGANIKKDEVQLLVVGASVGAYAFLESGKVDAFVATNHVGVELTYNKSPIKILPINDYLKVPSDDVIINQDNVTADPDTALKVVRGLQNARKWAMLPENLDTVVKYCAKYTPDETKNVELAKLKINDDIKRWTGDNTTLKLGQIDKAGWTSLQDLLLTNAFVPKKLALTDLIDTTFIDQVEPA